MMQELWMNQYYDDSGFFKFLYKWREGLVNGQFTTLLLQEVTTGMEGGGVKIFMGGEVRANRPAVGWLQ